jgi:hypothetical protein
MNVPHPEDDDYDYNLSVILKKPRKERKPKSIKAKDIKLDLERVGNNLSLQTLDWTALNVKTSTPNISRKDHSSDSEDEDLREVKSMENPSHDRIQENITEIELEKIRDSVKQLFSEKSKVITGKKEGYNHLWPKDTFNFDDFDVNLLQKDRFVTLRPHKWLDAGVLDDFIEELIRIGHVKLIKYEDSILFLNQSYYKLLDEQKWTELLPILHHVRPLNKDIILISMHVNSNHWILGGIFFREKTLVIFDSNRQNNKTMLKKCFTNLTKLAIACFTIAGIHFGDNSNWK